ncbi:MAG: hypothetical protein HY872_13105 [Chloroflexi bacterium]|nr:hypothetical protein [Chloroflexota bacterium]
MFYFSCNGGMEAKTPGYARITNSNDHIYVRFERVGNREKFITIIDRFNEAFLLKDWEEKKRAWKLVPDDLNTLIEFCRKNFGPKGYIIQNETDVKDSKE